jgi:hypothetical protein
MLWKSGLIREMTSLEKDNLVGFYIFGKTLTIEAPFLWSGCGRVVYGAGNKAKRLVKSPFH